MFSNEKKNLFKSFRMNVIEYEKLILCSAKD